MSSWRDELERINEDFREMRVTWMGMPRMVLNVLTEQNADEVISSLSGPARDSFLEWARYVALSDDDDIISFDAPGGKPTADTRQKLHIVRAWVEAHPLPDRPEPFPVELVKGLLSRVDSENHRLIQLIGKNRKHPDRERSRRATSVVVDLMNALNVATNGASRPQAQAFAWELLDRALRNVHGLIDLTEEERRLAGHRPPDNATRNST